MKTNGAQNHMQSFFGGQFLSGKSGRVRAKILRTPKNLPAPTPMPQANGCG